MKKVVSVTLDYEVHAKLKDLAEYQDSSVSRMVNIILKRYFAQLEQKESSKDMKDD